MSVRCFSNYDEEKLRANSIQLREQAKKIRESCCFCGIEDCFIPDDSPKKSIDILSWIDLGERLAFETAIGVVKREDREKFNSLVNDYLAFAQTIDDPRILEIAYRLENEANRRLFILY